MTKELFRKLASALIDEICSLPPDVWEVTDPMMTAEVGDEIVVVGIKSAVEVKEA